VSGTAVKADLRAGRASLEELWRRGMAGRALLEEQTRLVDEFLSAAFAAAGVEGGAALLALGGYGRRELFPFSDIDLLLVHDGLARPELERLAAAVFHPLWDAGLEVGHGVRTLAGCIEDATDDFFFRVALLDGRLVAGSEALFDNLVAEYRHRFIDGNRREFFHQMTAHRQQRHQRFGMHTYLLEPHVKESRGGLRDIHTMLWTARVLFGLASLDDMEAAGLLTADEMRVFAEAWDKLVRIRNRLHYLSGRRNDRLFFEHQEEMARAFGYHDRGGVLAVERFMRDVHDALQTVAVTTDLFFEHAREVLGAGAGSADCTDRRLEKGIEVRCGRICLIDSSLLDQRPQLGMRLFWLAARHRLPLHYRTRKLLAGAGGRIDDRFRNSKRVARVFLDLLQQDSAAEVLATMLETGYLAAYLPEFKPIESLAQHDVYHVNTVDRHLIQTVAELHRLRDEEARIFQEISSPHILFLAGLCHDIGKGQGEGHAGRGATLVRGIGARLGLGEGEIECLAFLVEHHLFLVHIAQRRDLEDEALIIRCAERIRDADRLAMLYLLTIADARATGPSVWNDWKAALVLELYLKIAHLLDRDDLELAGMDREQAARWMAHKVREALPADAVVDPQDLPADYLVSFPPEEVVRHIGLRAGLQGRDLLFDAVDAGDHWSILVMTADRPGLLARICGGLALHNLRILTARIFTWPDGTVVDALDVVSAVGSSFADQDWRAVKNSLWLAVNNRLGLDYRLHKKLRPLAGTEIQGGGRLPVRVEIDNIGSDNCSIIELYATDRVGLLYEVTKTLADFGLNILRARIGSKGDQVVDVFYVQDAEGGKVEEPEFQEEIRRALLHVATHELRARCK